ncbi:MAG: hypothetical protein AB1485_04790 [Candidatus Thermoplasmatota archaeon]
MKEAFLFSFKKEKRNPSGKEKRKGKIKERSLFFLLEKERREEGRSGAVGFAS